MPLALAATSEATPDRVRSVVARMLRVDPASLDPAQPLTCYGLDSLTAVQLVTDLEDAFGRRLPEWLLFEHPTLGALSDVLCGGESEDDELALMRADCALPEDIRPAANGAALSTPHHVLLTGATGFLGASLLRAILENPAVRVTCLVRPVPGDREPVAARVRNNLERYGLWCGGLGSRIDVASGDLTQGALGLSPQRYEELARSVDVIYHAGAGVNWVLGYRALRAANVLGTTELLRFACAERPKHFHFISSMSVCYATGGPAVVDEDTDLLPHLGGLPLGYARTKCVAEALVRQAAARGLCARIYRPALLAGDARTGASNVDDLMSLLLKGCIQMGAAPDLDWTFDAVPVDCAARAIVSLADAATAGLATIHLRHPRPRHWRECVLWGNLLGYPMRLEPFERWHQRLDRDASDPGHALHRLRPFFAAQTVGSMSVAELYEERTRSVVADDQSRAMQRVAEVDYPALDADLLDRYFQDYVTRGFLPPASPALARDCRARGGAGIVDREIPPILQNHFGDPMLDVRLIAAARNGSDHSIIGELMSWRHGRRLGLFHYRFELETSTRSPRRACPPALDVIVKTKASDEDVMTLAETIAGMCDERLAREVRRHRERIGLRGSHLRELAIYEQPGERIKAYLPVCYGTWRRDADVSWGLVLERLDNMLLLDATDDGACWQDEYIAAAIDGLATIHSAWLGREAELAAEPWMGHIATSESAVRMTPLWRALADHAAPQFNSWAGPALVKTHRLLAATASRWWPALEALPRTLIHNDFNSRNIGIRHTPTGPRLVAYDWELATIGAPQRDLAELLCFVLPADVSEDVLVAWVERHRAVLERESGVPLAPDHWRLGFDSALSELLVSRLSFYALVDRVTPQSFLPRVLRTWQRLHHMAAPWASLS